MIPSKKKKVHQRVHHYTLSTTAERNHWNTFERLTAKHVLPCARRLKGILVRTRSITELSGSEVAAIDDNTLCHFSDRRTLVVQQ